LTTSAFSNNFVYACNAIHHQLMLPTKFDQQSVLADVKFNYKDSLELALTSYSIISSLQQRLYRCL